jgi:hypothetical protein
MRNLTAHLNRRFLKLLPAALVIVLILSIIGPNTASANPGWYNTSWQYRKKITIHAAGVSADLTDFPLLIYLGSDGDLAADAQNDGDDIIFTAADEVTRLSHEIEYFDGATGNLTAWVKIPSLSSTTDTEIYMYYGNAGAANSENVTDVWDSNYKMVQHLEETSGGANAILDSTSYHNDGTDSNTPTFNAAGKLDGAISFDGVNEYIGFGYGNSVNITRPLTIEAWIKPNTVPAGNSSEPIVFRDDGSKMNYALSIASGTYTGNTGVKVLFWREDSVDTDNKTYGTTEIVAGNWYHIVVVDAGSQGTYGNFSIYVNGGLAEGVKSCNFTAYDSAAHKLVVADTNGERIGGGAYFNGIIDEVRISSYARTPDWITTSYNNQVNPAGFYTLGPEENATVLPTVTTNDATVVQETTATLNGHLDNDGGAACQYAFEWGTASGVYTANISWTGSINTGADFSTNLIGLTKGQPYYYRAMVKNASGVAYGGEIHFLTKPDGPVVLTATANSSSRIDLTWTKGTGAQRTMIRRSAGTYPASYTDGDEVYFDTGTNFSDTGLTDNMTFYYRAWSEVTGSQQFSNTFASASAKTFAAQQVSPSIIGGKVYSVNKAAVLLPWILGSLASAFILVQIFFYVRKKIKSRQNSGKIAPYKSKPPP